MTPLGTRLDTGNRAFWTMVPVPVLTRALIGYGACCRTMAIIDAVHAGGAAALWASSPTPLPALLLLAVLAIGTARGAWSLGRSAWRTAAFVRAVRHHLTGTPPRLQTVADLTTPFALTYRQAARHMAQAVESATHVSDEREALAATMTP